MEHILILGMVIGSAHPYGATSQAVLFPTYDACEKARVKAEETFSTGGIFSYFKKAQGVCVPRHALPGRPA
ncbi:MAG: hypothetical protein EPO10_17715 [Reyranella sp.]|uniref:hypothetical protein n=1 Tax=Reyranella sp. TaxID=1929291 RepID=UPI001219822B|nr:hypothetical protein [Reyranella sp.]TAJ97177.1 MAG: hypothetical protein EPO41_04070 [Reyranella sp.]TBR27517.1 MAG: hypothetical protein EPO10_17715 [Reyranella sp.]